MARWATAIVLLWLGLSLWLLLRLGWRLGLWLRELLLAAGAAVSEHLLELLLLRICQQSFDAVAAVVHNSLHAGTAVARSEALVGAEDLNLLLAIGDDGPDLGNLLAAEAELPGEKHCLALRICRAALGLLSGWVILGVLAGDADLLV